MTDKKLSLYEADYAEIEKRMLLAMEDGRLTKDGRLTNRRRFGKLSKRLCLSGYHPR